MLSDVPELARLRWDFSLDELKRGTTFEEFYCQFAAFLQEALLSGQWAFWVVASEYEILATTFVEIVRKVPRPNRLRARWGYVTNVYVVPAERNNGVGAALIHQVQAWAQAQHLEFLILWPSERAIPFYGRAGFVANGEILQWDSALKGSHR